MATLLSAGEVEQALGGLNGWAGDPGAISRTVKAPEFLVGVRLVEAVAEAAERANHHPDVDIRWRNVTFTLATHSDGGVTAKDVELARRIDELAASHGCD